MYIAVRSSSNMSIDGVDAGLSVPMPTRTPAANSLRSGAIPQPRTAFERGQCATATSCSASKVISSSSTWTQCAATTRSLNTPSSASFRIAVVPYGATSRCAYSAHGPVPEETQSCSASLSARCVATGSPNASHAE